MDLWNVWAPPKVFRRPEGSSTGVPGMQQQLIVSLAAGALGVRFRGSRVTRTRWCAGMCPGQLARDLEVGHF
eukprot:CAMPEP_0173370428 /NCGR_PEP_ID=MMETSP1144-20121109/26687_1 /TAXON_ID=483371 /ORGANISM="non described non described, Strain CCMP2298" /LENGTH=71 /DNA_ID=CAMNT_0014321991 /DNA_START=42 /DNA_END=254 /DNA_ORIENTATION=-